MCAKFVRDFVRAQKCWDRADWLNPADHAQQLIFVFRTQPVAGLRFDGGGSVFEKPCHVFLGRAEQIGFACSAGSTNGRSDSTTGCRNLSVGSARSPLFKFIGAIARENRMRVRVDEAGHHDAISGVDNCHIAPNPGTRTHPFDSPVRNQHRAIGNDCEIAHFGSGARACRTSQRYQLRAIDNGGAAHCAESSIGIRMPFSRATSMALGYPASACRITPIPGSVVNTRCKRRPPDSVPSATTTIPACCEYPMPTPPPLWIETHEAPAEVLTSAFSSGQSDTASDVSSIASVSR